MSHVTILKYRLNIASISQAEDCSSIARVWLPKLEYRTHNVAHCVMPAIFERYFTIVTRDTLTILEPYLTLRAVLVELRRCFAWLPSLPTMLFALHSEITLSLKLFK